MCWPFHYIAMDTKGSTRPARSEQVTAPRAISFLPSRICALLASKKAMRQNLVLDFGDFLGKTVLRQTT